MANGAHLISSAVLGVDGESIVVNDKPYFIQPPKIYQIAGVGKCLSVIENAGDFKSLLKNFENVEQAARALSWFIKGDESLTDELKKGTLEEVVLGISKGLSLITIDPFVALSTLSKSVQRMIAKQK